MSAQIDKDELIAEWLDVQDKMKFYKRQESSIRKEIGAAFGIDKMVEGVNHRQTDGFMVEINRRFNYKLVERELDEIWDELSDEERNCVVTKRSLSKSKYNDLLDSSMLDDAILIDDALLSVKVTPIT